MEYHLQVGQTSNWSFKPTMIFNISRWKVEFRFFNNVWRLALHLNLNTLWLVFPGKHTDFHFIDLRKMKAGSWAMARQRVLFIHFLLSLPPSTHNEKQGAQCKFAKTCLPSRFVMCRDPNAPLRNHAFLHLNHERNVTLRKINTFFVFENLTNVKNNVNYNTRRSKLRP